MTLNVTVLVKANAAQAKQELASVADRTKAFGTQQRLAGGTASQLEAAVAAQALELRKLDAQLRALIASQEAANEKARQTVPAFNGGAQSVGNMVAQLNDIGVMVAAGQNPLQLAIQQGTQITQGFGNRGAAGAVRMLKDGFVSMLSPLNLGTIAILAGGAALVQWGLSALGAAQDTKTFTERVDDAQASIDELNTFVKTYSIDGLQALKEKYGEVNAGVLELVESQRLIALDDAAKKVREAVAAINADIGDGWLNGDYGEIQRVFSVTQESAVKLYGVMQDISNADLDQQLKTVITLKGLLSEATDGFSNMNEEQKAMLRNLTLAEDLMRQLAASAPQASWMNSAISGVNSLIGRIGAAITANARLRAGVSAPTPVYTAQQIYDQQNDVYSGRGGPPPGFGGNRPGQFTPTQTVVDLADGLLNPGSGGGTGGGGGGGGAARAERDAVAELIAKLREEQAVLAELDPVKQQMLRYREQLSTATAAERAAVEELIRVREQERAIDQLTDFGANSVIDFLRSVRTAGDGASAALKKIGNAIFDMGIQALIAGRGPLAQLLGISGNIFQGGGGGGWLGWLFGSLFGRGGGGTGTLGLPAFANGMVGMVFGPGGGRDDKVPAWLSSGESVINARATARYRPLLERINSNVPAFADGFIGGSAGAGLGGAGGARHMTININLAGANGNAEIERIAFQAVQQGIEQFDRQVLPQRVARISSQPRRRG